MNQRELRQLIEAAKRARRKAYCPYTRYPVGAAVLTDTGRIFTGANVENASYGLSICAERAAIFNAVTRGEKALRAICVVARSARPCGACRQVMIEFSSKETELVLVNIAGDHGRETVVRMPMRRVLPFAFDPLDAGLLPPNPQNLLKKRLARGARRRRDGRRTQEEKRREPRAAAV
jgi:cytidine deaminase